MSRPIPDPDGEYEQYLQNGGYFDYSTWVAHGKPKPGNEGGKWIGDTTQRPSEGTYAGGDKAINTKTQSWEDANGNRHPYPGTGYYESTDEYHPETKTITHTETNQRPKGDG